MLMALIGWTKAATAAIGCGHAALLGNVPLRCKEHMTYCVVT
jgi:hypothetical protein